ncbi:MAG: adenosylcobinamide-GDP ribazoletransferase [Desulfatiglans sp.]|jgi:adenosylcobinamide-GDP ribazoletransferase|nr:adenosylcobinamide-GDP ribazoletransferase [Desulfatiglans sp.]
MKGFISAFRTLTSLPVPGKEADDFFASLPWFPAVGLILGLILYGISYGWTRLPFEQWPAGCSLFMVAAGIWLTGGLHLDGLADWADSLGGFHDREKRLAIMKDVRLGTFGGLALIIFVLAKWLALERLVFSGSTFLIPPIFACSRAMLVELITTLPYARADEGMAGAFILGASGRHRLFSHALCLLVCLPFGPVGLVLLGMSWLMAWLFKIKCRSRFGGITGDLLGTANEIIEVILLILCALAGKHILCYTGPCGMW